MHDLTYFRDEDLLSLARNPSAQTRHEAVKLLVERGSSLAAHPDIVDESSSMIHNNPLMLKKLRPAVNYGNSLPGVVDVVCRTNERQSALESQAVRIVEITQQQAQALADASQKLQCDIGNTDAYVKDLEQRYEETRLAFSVLSDRFEDTLKKYEHRFALVERTPVRKLYDWAIAPIGVTLATFFTHAIAWAKGLL